jgi:hypothetical protein
LLVDWLLELPCELLGSEPFQGPMGPSCVVGISPAFEDPSRIAQVQEPVLIQAFIADTAIEGFNVGVVHGLTGSDEVKPHLVI